MSWSKKTWAEEHLALADVFRRWGVQQWEVSCAFWGQKASNYTQTPQQRAVFIKFAHPDGQTIQLRMDSESRAIDNLQQMRLGLNEMYGIWRRGLENMVRTAYMQLSAPEVFRDPYEVLGVRPDTDVEDIEAMYRIKAKRSHPDIEGGSDAAMKGLNEAIERIRADRGDPA
jgi:hypothetical protein